MPTPHLLVSLIISTNTMSEGVSDFLQEIQQGSIKATVRRLLELRNGNGKISKESYNDTIKSLASIGIVMSYATLRKRVSCASSVASDDIPPTKEVTMSGEEFSGVSTLTPVTLSDNSSKVGRPKGSTDAYKREMDLKYQACVNSITREFVTLHGTTSK